MALLYIDSFSGHIKVLFGSSGSVMVGAVGSVNIDARVGHDGILVVGDKTTINGARFVAVKSHILVGQDGLWSDEILAQGFDQHGIFDLDTREMINSDKCDIVINRHVWVGRRSTLMPHIEVGKGAIIGAGAVVTKSVPAFSAAGGNPARIVRDGVSWSRPWARLDDETLKFLDAQSSDAEPD